MFEECSLIILTQRVQGAKKGGRTVIPSVPSGFQALPSTVLRPLDGCHPRPFPWTCLKLRDLRAGLAEGGESGEERGRGGEGHRGGDWPGRRGENQ